MSNLVSQIIAGIETEVEAQTSYTKLKYVFDLEKNDYAKKKSQYGVKPLSATAVTGLNKVYTVDQVFSVTLVRGYRNKSQDDVDLQTEIKTLYTNMDEIVKGVHLNKAGVPSIVLVVNLSDIDEPEILEEQKVVALTANFVIKYRNTVD